MKRLYWVGLALLLAGCSRLGTGAGYKPVPVSNFEPLAGRIICLDPGHGGRWPGAVAPANGLRESDVNLQVALRVAEILRNAGAEVVLTRTTDNALTPESLQKDLTARATMANEANADVFVSIHHNADIRPRSKKNDLEVYYKLGDHWTSLPLAQELTRALAYGLNKKAVASRLLPGNYRVLRMARTPAVLLESAYLTNKKSARVMAAPAGVEREAQAIVEGLAAYFALDPGRVVSVNVCEPGRDGRQRAVAAFTRGLPVDPHSVVAMVDGSRVSGRCIPNETGFTWIFTDILPNGHHGLRIAGRNRLGAGFSVATFFETAREAHTVHITQRPADLARQSAAEVEIEVRVLDAAGLPVADGTEVGLEGTAQAALTRGGRARFHLFGSALPPHLVASAGTIVAEKPTLFGDKSGRTVRIRNAKTSEPIKQATLLSEDTILAVTSDDGWAVIDGNASCVTVLAKGYAACPATLTRSHTLLALAPVDEGVLHELTIMIDPAAGGRLPGAVGPGGLRACDVALDVSARLAEKLRAAGATVRLTRDGDEEMSGLSRVRASMTGDVDLYMMISFGMPEHLKRTLNSRGKGGTNPRCFVGHYPGSRNGRRLAEIIERLLPGLSAVPSAAYELQQTPCPAVLIQPEDVTRGKGAERCRDARVREDWSGNIYRAVVEYAQSRKSR